MKGRVTTHIKYDRPDDGTGWIIFGFALFIIENIYFGWNMHAQSGAERVCDLIYTTALVYGSIRFIAVSTFNSIMESFNVDLSIEPVSDKPARFHDIDSEDRRQQERTDERKKTE